MSNHSFYVCVFSILVYTANVKMLTCTAVIFISVIIHSMRFQVCVEIYNIIRHLNKLFEPLIIYHNGTSVYTATGQ